MRRSRLAKARSDSHIVRRHDVLSADQGRACLIARISSLVILKSISMASLLRDAEANWAARREAEWQLAMQRRREQAAAEAVAMERWPRCSGSKRPHVSVSGSRRTHGSGKSGGGQRSKRKQSAGKRSSAP